MARPRAARVEPMSPSDGASAGVTRPAQAKAPTRCACCGFDDPRMLRAHALAGGRHVLCANCVLLADGQRVTLSELVARRYPEASPRRASSSSKPRPRALGVPHLIRERERATLDSPELPCECATCTSGGRPIHRVPRFSS